MTDTRIAAEITVSAVDLTDTDFDELRTAIEDAAAAWKATVTVTNHHEYEA